MARASKSYIAIDTIPMPERTVRVTLPAKVAYDLRSIQKIQASVLDRLGCQACCSGWDIIYDVTRDFAVNEQLEITEIIGGGGQLER